MMLVTEFYFDYTSTSLGARGFIFRGGEENAASPHFPPLLVVILDSVAERSRGHIELLVRSRVLRKIKIESRPFPTIFSECPERRFLVLRSQPG